MLRYLTRAENRKTAHTVVVIMRTVIRAFPFQEPSCALQAGHHLTWLQKPTIRSGNKCLEDSALSKGGGHVEQLIK